MDLMNGNDDELHLGKLFLKSLRMIESGVSIQINGITEEQESVATLLRHTVDLAMSFRNNKDIAIGDVIAIVGHYHMDLHKPHYAGLLEGLPVIYIDYRFKCEELQILFLQTKPKVIFCPNAHVETMETLSRVIGLQSKIITFDGEYTINKFIEENINEPPNVETYEPVELDVNKHIAWLVNTSAANSFLAKTVVFTHKHVAEAVYFYGRTLKCTDDFVAFNCSSPQWVWSYFHAIICPLLNISNVFITGSLQTEDIVYDFVKVINIFKPTSMIAMWGIIEEIVNFRGFLDLRCFKCIRVGGDKVFRDSLIELLPRLDPGCFLHEFYSLTEVLVPVLMPTPGMPPGSCGRSANGYLPFQVKLVDPSTGVEVTTPQTVGQLLIKGNTYVEYLKNPEENARALDEDGWFKTGDLFYYDRHNDYYHVGRMSCIIQHNDFALYPTEIEEVIRRVPGVVDVAVIGLPDEERQNVAAAIVVRGIRPRVTDRIIKTTVEARLSEEKWLYGGVAFVDVIPKTLTGKQHVHALRSVMLALVFR